MKKIRGAPRPAANTALRGKDVNRRRHPHHSHKEEFAQLMAKKKDGHKGKESGLHNHSEPAHDPALAHPADDKAGASVTRSFHRGAEQKEQRGKPDTPSALSQRAQGDAPDASGAEGLSQRARGDAPDASGAEGLSQRAQGAAPDASGAEGLSQRAQGDAPDASGAEGLSQRAQGAARGDAPDASGAEGLSQRAQGAARGDAPDASGAEGLSQRAQGAARGDASDASGAEGMGEKILRSRGGARRETSAEPNEAAAAMASGMSAVAARRGGDAAAPETALAAGAASPAEVNQLIDKTVSRILVSSPDSGPAREVRLQLDGKLLGGTEVRIANVDGQLSVEFLPSTADAGNFLSQQHGHIQEALSKNLKQQKVAVEINHEAHERGGGTKRGHSRIERKPGTQSSR